MPDLNRLTASQLAPYASAGNGFGRIEDARAVAKAHPGEELIAKEGEQFVLYAKPDDLALNRLGSSSGRVLLEFVDAQDRVLNLDNEAGIKGVGVALKPSELGGKASAGNSFARYTHAEAVAKNLRQPVAIVSDGGTWRLHALSPASAARLRSGNNDLLDARVSAVVSSGETLYNWGAQRASASSSAGMAYADGGKLMLDGKPYTIRGLNVYDLVDVGRQSEAELRETLKLIADSGVNSVRMLTLSRHTPDEVKRVLDASKDMGLDLKFIPVLGNHWQHVEGQNSAYVKDENWYKRDFEHHYWPAAEKLVTSLMDRPEVLMWELMNEPEAEPETLRNFADEVSTRIHTLYADRDASAGQSLPRHLIGLGTRGVGHYGDEAPGQRGHDFKDLYGLPHLDVATVHDYTSSTLEGSIADYMRYARELNKPYFLGEIGVKVRAGGTEAEPKLGLVDKFRGHDPVASRQQALARLREKVAASQAAGSSGAMLWGPQPRGHAVDGDGYGFSYTRDGAAFDELKAFFGGW